MAPSISPDERLAQCERRRYRTEQKLRYAELHLNELKQMPPGRGHEFERSHQEAVFAQLIGAYDAFLLELNDILGCGRRDDDISLGKLRKSLKDNERSSATLLRLHNLREDKGSWLRQLLDLRNTAIHRVGVPLGFNAHSGKAVFRHPDTLEDFTDDANITLSQWLNKMRYLTNELREIAIAEE